MTPGRLIVVALILLLCVKCHLDAREYPVEGSYSGPADVAAPEADEDSIGRIDVRGPGVFQFSGGTNFLVDHKGVTYLVGAYHVLGGVREESTVKLLSVGGELAEAEPRAIDVPYQDNSSYASELAKCRSRGDMAVLRVKKTDPDAQTLELSQTPALIGQPVWVLQLTGGAGRPPTGSRLLSGKVAYHSNQLLALRMDQKSDVAWTSGAPVLNADGRVVGVNVGQYMNQDGYYRVCVPTQTLRDTFARL